MNQLTPRSGGVNTGSHPAPRFNLREDLELSENGGSGLRLTPVAPSATNDNEAEKSEV
jgi:hypothetical protein